jgi:hypothetical protein
MPILGLQSSSQKISSYGRVSDSAILSPLKVSGTKIVDATDVEVKLRGFELWDNDYIYGFGDREPYAPQWVYDRYMPLTQEHLNQIKRWGLNTVLLDLWWTSPRLEPNEDLPQVYNEEWVDNVLLELIRMANEAGLYVIPSIRVCFDPNYTASGNYPWSGWSTHDYVVFNQLDSSGQYGLERFCKFLEWFTRKVQGEPNVIGIDPWHFPYHRQSVDSERVTTFNTIVAPAIIDAVRKHTNKIIFLSPVHLGRYDYTNRKPYDDPNIVYNTGGYGHYNIAASADSPIWDYDVSKINVPHRSAWTFRDKYNVPVMSIEGPGIAQHPNSTYGRPLRQDRIDLFETVLTMMDDLSGWIIWQYSGPGGNWGVLENENPNDPASEGQIVEILKMHTAT